MEAFKEKVKKLREKKDWAQEDLAREIDVSLSTVQRWEGKGAKPTRHARRQLARLFKEAGIDGDDQGTCRGFKSVDNGVKKRQQMELGFAINEVVEVKAPGIQVGHRGWVVSRFAYSHSLQAVQFPDNCVGYFDRWELSRVPPKELAAEWKKQNHRVFIKQP